MTVIPGTRYIKRSGALVALGSGGTGGSGGTAGTASALDRLRAQFAKAATQPVRLAFTGSSTTEDGRYQERLLTALKVAYPSGGTEQSVQARSLTADFTPSTANGIQGYNAGQGGTTAATYLTADERTKIAALNPAMVMHMPGSNDYLSNVAPATYQAQVAASVDDLTGKAPQAIQVLVHPYQRTDGTYTYPWSAYRDALAQVAATRPNVIFIDLSALYALLGVPGADALDLLSTDNVHQNDLGYSVMAEALRLALGVPGTPVTPTTVPTAPTGLTAGTPTVTTVPLSWSAVSGATAYKVEHKASSGSTWTVDTTSATGTSYTVTGLTASTAYDFRVSASNTAGTGTPSTVLANVTTGASSDTTAPTVPTGLTVGTVTSTTVPLSWTASTDAVGVTGYKVRRGGTVVGTPTGTSYTDTGLVASTAYSYTVSAVDAAGNESAQTAAVNTTTAAGAPSAVVSDTFNRVDNPNNLGTADTGQTWTGTDFKIVGNKAVWRAGSGHTFIETGLTDMDVQADIDYVGGSSIGVQFNSLDTSNRLLFYIDGVGKPNLAKVDTDTLSNLNINNAVTPAAGLRTLRVVCKGAQITGYIDGVSVLTYTLTAPEVTKFKAYTKAGLRQGSATTATGIDNFVVKAAA